MKKKELLFFEREDFYEFQELKEAEGYEIIGIFDFLKNKDLINTFDSTINIVDLTVLAAYTHTQYIAEDILYLFDNSTIFIADKNQKELFTYELRHCFENFNDIDIPRTIEHSDSKKESQSIKRRHKKIIDLSEEELNDFFLKLREGLYGHEKFKDDFCELVRTFRIFNKIKEHKILSLFLLGESGVGKTEVARTLYRCLGGQKKLAKVNFGNYSSEFSLSSLIGSARGYIGSDDGEIFIRVRDTDVGVILIDEFEKSNASLFNYFLDVLESGKIISSLAEEIDLNGFIIVFTSNINKEDFPLRISPELRSRFDYKGQFTLLYDEDKEKYVEFRVNSIVRKVNKEYNIQLPANLYEFFLEKIDVSKFKNMRDLNKKIKRTFVNYLTSEQPTLSEYEDITTQSKISIGRKILKIFKGDES
jgi:ATP-dependent Clp protease ATP-binding subunit ClpC